MDTCNVCGKTEVPVALDLGPQPVCHHFITENDDNELYPLRLGQCDTCATVQLIGPAPVEALIPRYPWITCTEPEDHLDELVDKLINLPGINKDSRVVGISFKEDTTLARFHKRGFNNTWRIPEEALEIDDTLNSVETVQQRLTTQVAENIVANTDQADILIARHIIEHAYDLRGFIQACRIILSAQGYLVFEIPDCHYALNNFDYTTVWEEHTIYFTPRTFKQMFALHDLELIEMQTIPYLQEQSHIGIARLSTRSSMQTLTKPELDSEKEQAKRFFQVFAENKNSLHKYMDVLQKKFGPLALLGAERHKCQLHAQ